MVIRDEPWSQPNPDRVQLKRLAWVQYGHPDLEKYHQFILNFGLRELSRVSDPTPTIFYTGYGTQNVVYVAVQTETPKFLGLYFEAQTFEDLERATKIPGAKPIEQLNLPGGGSVVNIVDPVGFNFGVAYGLKDAEFKRPQTDLLPYNYPAPTDADAANKPRRGRFQRLHDGPVPVHKVGHSGFWSPKLETSADFYAKHFNFKPSDIMLGPTDEPNLIFFHVDLGKEYSDHHSFILGQAQGPMKPGVHHTAFEVESIDHQFIAHDYLAGQGYKPFWGVGRHVEGSQVFDYWFDLDGFLIEHYADGDLVNEDTEINWVKPRAKNNNWGPELPSF